MVQFLVVIILVEIQYEYTAIFYYLCFWEQWKEEIRNIKIGRDNTSNKIYFSKTIKKYFVFTKSSHRFYQKNLPISASRAKHKKTQNWI